MLFGLWKEGRNKEQSQCCSLLSLDKMKIPVSLCTETLILIEKHAFILNLQNYGRKERFA
jgi:hypothetical protein